MFTNKIPKHTKKLLKTVTKVLPAKTYLAGGTALALHLNHRPSYDLDLYTSKKFDITSFTQAFEKHIPYFQVTSQLSTWQTIIGKSKDTEVSLFFYEYQLLQPTKKYNNLSIASLEDIAAMKIEAVASRGLKRDFFDIYSICNTTTWTLKDIIELNQKKYKRRGSNTAHIIKSLVYFEDAEKTHDRSEVAEEQWKKTKHFFTKKTPELVKTLL